MFSFFKKQSPLPPFQNFTEYETLIAINMVQFAGMCDLDTLSNSQDSIYREVEFLNYYVRVFNSSSKKATELLNRLGHHEIIKRFEALDNEKIEKILMLILGMFHADGPLNDTEETFLKRLLSKVNITEEELVKKLKLAKMFLKESE